MGREQARTYMVEGATLECRVNLPQRLLVKIIGYNGFDLIGAIHHVYVGDLGENLYHTHLAQHVVRTARTDHQQLVTLQPPAAEKQRLGLTGKVGHINGLAFNAPEAVFSLTEPTVPEVDC